MFVRNNTACPHCGKSQIFDVSVQELNSDNSYIQFTAQCSYCDFKVIRMIPAQMVLAALLAGSEFLPTSDSRRRCHNWATPYTFDRRMIGCIQRLASFTFFPEISDWKFAERSPIRTLLGWIVSPSGDVNHLLSKSWLSFPYKWADIRRELQLLGQPLAS